jgi:hypothetical protein
MKMICARFVLTRKFFFCSHRGNLNLRESNHVDFGNGLQMALIEHAYRLNNFEKEKGMRLDACDRPFPSSNELQRARIPTRLRYPNCSIQDARLGELLQRNMDCRSNPSIGRHFVRRGARQRNRRCKCCLLMRTPAKAASNPTRQRLDEGPSGVPGFRPRHGAEPAIYRIKMADRR